MLTREALARFAPRPAKAAAALNWDGYVDALVSPEIAKAMEDAGLTTVLRLRHFLAQCAHECGGFTILWEDMSYRADRISEIFGVGRHSARVTRAEAATLAHKPEALAERVYGIADPKCCGQVTGCTKLKTVKICKARELGNRDAGDGYRCRGFGIMQTTGRTDHDRLLAGVYSYASALRAALAEWVAKGCNALADADNLEAITRKINGGTNGLQDRRRWFAKATGTWPNEDLEEIADAGVATLKEGDEGASVKRLQELLVEKGWFDRVDGVYGPRTTDAVMVFQRNHGLEPDGKAGPLTFETLEKAPRREERQVDTKVLVDNGHEGVTFSQWVKLQLKRLGKALGVYTVDTTVGPGAINTVAMTAIDTADKTIGKVEKVGPLFSKLTKLSAGVPWGWVAGIAAAAIVLVLLYVLIDRLEKRFLKRAKEGANLKG